MKILYVVGKDSIKVPFPLPGAILSETIKSLIHYDTNINTIDDFDIPGDVIPLTEVNSNILELVILFCNHILEEKQPEDVILWEKNFLQIDNKILFDLILAANYLDIKPLLDSTCKQVAEYIKQCKTPQEIRRRFNIKNDFTPEEEEEIRKENSWCQETK